MKVESQQNHDLTQLSKLIENIPVCMLSSIDASGALVSRPMAPLEMTYDGAIWFFTDLNSGKVGHLECANLSFVSESNGTYVSISGAAEICQDQVHVENLWTPFARPWFPDGPQSNNIGLLKFLPNAAEYWDAPHSKLVRIFAVAASVIASKPVGMGDHDTLTSLTKPVQNSIDRQII
ncbi:MAG: pyridoxamine 5'-phosphate oxidase family protein [Methylophilaceae bacterium]|nr:pyridoxamine 5'-phosphate oxidase family protein [Methylophilaceae bacterium]